MDEQTRAWLELIEERIEAIDQIIFGIQSLRVPGIIARVEAAAAAAAERDREIENRLRRAIWAVACSASVIWLITSVLLVLFIKAAAGA